MIYPRIINSLIIVLILFCIPACASKKNLPEDNEGFESNPKLIFLNYTISESKNGKKSIQFINKIIADGKLKKSNNKYIKKGISGDLECNQLDKNSNIIQGVIVKNPLKKTIESLNDSLSFQTKQITLSNTPFTLKLKLNPNTKYIAINEITKPQETTKTLIKTKLN